MSKKLIIYGAGDLGREIMYAAKENMSEIYETEAFVEIDAEKIGGQLERTKIISHDDAIKELKNDVYLFIGIADPIRRKKVAEELSSMSVSPKFATIIHRSVIVMPNTTIEDGVFIAPHATIAVGCHLKCHAVINQNVSVGHDTVVGEYSVVSPGCVLSGRTKIGSTTFLGSNVVTYPKVSIGCYCSVSALTVVARNLKDKHTLVLKQNTMALPCE